MQVSVLPEVACCTVIMAYEKKLESSPAVKLEDKDRHQELAIFEEVMQDSCNMLRPYWYPNAYIRYCGRHPVSWLSKCPVQGQAGVMLVVQVTVETWSSMECRILHVHTLRASRY